MDLITDVEQERFERTIFKIDIDKDNLIPSNVFILASGQYINAILNTLFNELMELKPNYQSKIDALFADFPFDYDKLSFYTIINHLIKNHYHKFDYQGQSLTRIPYTIYQYKNNYFNEYLIKDIYNEYRLFNLQSTIDNNLDDDIQTNANLADFNKIAIDLAYTKFDTILDENSIQAILKNDLIKHIVL